MSVGVAVNVTAAGATQAAAERAAVAVSPLRREEWAAWDAFVAASPQGLPQHRAGWQEVLARAYGYRTHYLLARYQSGAQRGEIAGALPLYVVRSLLLGASVSTLPGGLCAADAATAHALLAAAQTFTRTVRGRKLTLHDSRVAWAGDWQTSCDHEDWVVDVRPGEEAVWARLDRNIRRQVRMAERNGLSAVVDRTGEHLDAFYGVLSRFTHQAGTPVFGRRFLAEVIRAFPDGFNLVMIYQGRLPVGGYFQLEVGKRNVGVWGATLHEFLELRPVYLAYWTILQDTMRRGLDYLDMGRSPAGSNASKYKGQWATFAQPVYQQTWSPQGRATASVAQLAHRDEHFSLFRRVWPQLPLPVTQAVGPWLRRHIPFA